MSTSAPAPFRTALAWLLAPVVVLASAPVDSPQVRLRRIERNLRPPVSFKGDVRWGLEDRMRHYGVPGLSLAIIENGKIVATRAYGMADREKRTPMSPATLLQAASISKAITAFGAMRMVQAGQVQLDEPVNGRLRTWRVPENDFTRQTPVTLAHLLGHTGGLTVHGFGGYETGRSLPTTAQILDGQPPANNPPVRVDRLPGEGWRYSGGGYTVAQVLLSDVSGLSFSELMKTQVLAPLGMSRSTFAYPLPEAWLKGAAAGILPNGKEVPGKRKVHPESAAAGLWTTPTDLARFAIAMQQALRGESPLLSRGLAQTLVQDRGDEYGLGFGLMRLQGECYFGHGGWNDGFSSHMTAHLNGVGLVVMLNANQPELIHEVRRAVAFEYGWPGYVEHTRQATPPEALSSLPGRYRYNPEQWIEITREGGQLLFAYGGEAPGLLTAIGKGGYVRERGEVVFRFAPDENRELRLQAVSPSGEVESFPRLAEGSRALRERLYGGDPSVVEDYRALAQRKALVASEDYLNRQGYRLLEQKRFVQAVQVMSLMTELYPDSPNAWDSLGEVCAAKGDDAAAIRHYERALVLAPDLSSAKLALETLRQKNRP